MKFYICPICGNVVYIMNGDINKVKCCGQPMQELIPNTVDASEEKHIPMCIIKDDKVEVKVGEVMHPMDADHYIMWVAISKDNTIEIHKFNPNEEASHIFNYTEHSTVYSYCNKHGLWKKEL